jgi:hypothetical protein
MSKLIVRAMIHYNASNHISTDSQIQGHVRQTIRPLTTNRQLNKTLPLVLPYPFAVTILSMVLS